MKVQHGITGNMYIVCETKERLLEICDGISKSRNAVYWNKKYETYALRIKCRRHKEAVRQFLFN